MEKYCHVITIEAHTLIDMVQRGIFSAVSRYSSDLCKTVARKKGLGISHRSELALAATISELSDTLMEETVMLKTAIETIPDGPLEEKVRYYHDVVFNRMNQTRKTIDQLEALTAASYWPYPTYYHLQFSV